MIPAKIGITVRIWMIVMVIARHVVMVPIVAMIVVMVLARTPFLVAAMIVAIEVAIAILEVRPVDAGLGAERGASAEVTTTEVTTAAKVAATEVTAAASFRSGCHQCERENGCACEKRRDRASSHDVPS